MIKKFHGDYRWLSNFWAATVIFDGVEYPTVENAYQAAKTFPIHRRSFIAITPGAAKRLGKCVIIRPEWESEKLAIMEALVLQKFSRHPELAKKLLATGEALLEEGNRWGDTFWGVCRGSGENHLGKILMKVRSTLKEEFRKTQGALNNA